MPIRWRAARRASGALEAMEPGFWFVDFGARLRYGARARAGLPKFPRIIRALDKAKFELSNDVYVVQRSYILMYFVNVEVAGEINFEFGKKSIFLEIFEDFSGEKFRSWGAFRGVDPSKYGSYEDSESIRRKVRAER